MLANENNEKCESIKTAVGEIAADGKVYDKIKCEQIMTLQLNNIISVGNCQLIFCQEKQICFKRKKVSFVFQNRSL